MRVEGMIIFFQGLMGDTFANRSFQSQEGRTFGTEAVGTDSEKLGTRSCHPSSPAD